MDIKLQKGQALVGKKVPSIIKRNTTRGRKRSVADRCKEKKGDDP